MKWLLIALLGFSMLAGGSALLWGVTPLQAAGDLAVQGLRRLIDLIPDAAPPPKKAPVKNASREKKPAAAAPAHAPAVAAKAPPKARIERPIPGKPMEKLDEGDRRRLNDLIASRIGAVDTP